MENTFDKLKFILYQDKSEQTANDLLYKYQLKKLFIPKEDDSFKLAFENGSDVEKIIVTLDKFVVFSFSNAKN